MADWRKLALDAILADGKIDEAEIRVLKKALWEDNKIDEEEVKFLIDLRNQAQKKAKAKKEEVNPAFTKLFFKAIEENVLKDKKIDDNEARWLREMLYADKKIDSEEKSFLQRIKKAATGGTGEEFNKLFDEATREPAPKKAPAAKKEPKEPKEPAPK